MAAIVRIAVLKKGGFAIAAVVKLDANGNATHLGYETYSGSNCVHTCGSLREAYAFVESRLRNTAHHELFTYHVLHPIVSARSLAELEKKLRKLETRLESLAKADYAPLTVLRSDLEEVLVPSNDSSPDRQAGKDQAAITELPTVSFN